MTASLRRSAAYFLAGVATLVLNAPGVLVDRADTLALSLGMASLIGGAAGLIDPRWRPRRRARFLLGELLFCLSVLLFLFLYVYALNANMDYVQRFIEEGGTLRLASSTERERWVALARCSPLLMVGLLSLSRGLLLTTLGAVLTSLAGPSFAILEGLPVLGYFGLVPLLLVIRDRRPAQAWLYGVYWGVLTSLLSMYWLGTFSLVSLQIAMIIQLFYYGLFMLAFVAVYQNAGRWRLLAVPLMWTVFEWLRSLGFLGFPWALFAHSQHRWVDLIQISALTGVWGVSFLVLLVNSVLATTVHDFVRYGQADRRPALAVLALLALVSGAGRLARLGPSGEHATDTSVRLALVQQNSDPRRHVYSETFATLKTLTDSVLDARPDMIVWSETAFVPNIRRWSREDPQRFSLARLVREFLTYQRGLGAWLLTGNDDYEIDQDHAGNTTRREYNAAVLFDDRGVRRETYRKIHLVPFTESFPFRDQLPRAYELLMSYDVTLWEPGSERTVFRHPKFLFATPICFEDIFPADVRAFVQAGAEVIVNLSNDYWSLTPVEAHQHYAAAVFRAVENRRPMVRASASGVTAHVDRFGRQRASGPDYREAVILADVRLGPFRTTLYTRWGDWFPVLCLAGAVLLIGGGRVRRRYQR